MLTSRNDNQEQEQIMEQEKQLAKPEKKQKSKKKKKDSALDSKKHQQPRYSSGKQPKTKLQQQEIAKQQSVHPPADPISQQLLSLYYDGLITPNQLACQTINSHLEQVTINLYEYMIMSGQLIQKAIAIARKSGLTPKEYFSLDYTNKILLIQKLMVTSGANKYAKYIQKIEEEFRRVVGLVQRSLEDVDIYGLVLADLRKNNVEWEIRRSSAQEETVKTK